MSLLNKQAPNFSLHDQNGSIISLSDYLGKKLLLIFYPGDETLICTKQLCEYNIGIDKFLELNIQLIGINKDNTNSHKKFIEKYNFSFPLLSDPQGNVCREFGVLSLSGVKRSIFLIDEKGKIVYENTILPIFYQKIEDLIKDIRVLIN